MAYCRVNFSIAQIYHLWSQILITYFSNNQIVELEVQVFALIADSLK